MLQESLGMCCGTVYEAASYRGISLSKDMALIYKVLRIASQRVFSEGWAWLAPPLPALSSLSPLFLERVDLPRENKNQRIQIAWTVTHSGRAWTYTVL